MAGADFRMIQAFRREPHDGVPVWFMRQAGRYLPGYQKVRSQTDFLTLCKTPDLAAEVTLEPLDTFGMDAVIIFSDIMVVLEGMGLPVTFTDRGPCMEKALETREDIEKLVDPDPEREIGYVMDVIREVQRRVDGRVPVLGFSGAPWPLACYALEGSPSRTFQAARQMIYRDPDSMHMLLDKIATCVVRYLKAQIKAGANAIQLFDSWGGMLPDDVFEEFSLQYCRRIIRELDDCGVPRILFVKGAGMHLNDVVECGSEAVGIDYTMNIERAKEIVAGRATIQGNLAPESLFGPEDDVRRRARKLLETFRGDPGFVFNLGHGILPKTPISNVHAVVDEIRKFSAEQ